MTPTGGSRVRSRSPVGKLDEIVISARCSRSLVGKLDEIVISARCSRSLVGKMATRPLDLHSTSARPPLDLEADQWRMHPCV